MPIGRHGFPRSFSLKPVAQSRGGGIGIVGVVLIVVVALYFFGGLRLHA